MSKDSQMELIERLCSIPELYITKVNNAVQDYLNNTRGMYNKMLCRDIIREKIQKLNNPNCPSNLAYT